jgi:hypothetical protein
MVIIIIIIIIIIIKLLSEVQPTFSYNFLFYFTLYVS